MNELTLLGAVLIGGLLVLVSVSLGAFVTYRVKNPNERLFQFKPPELGVINTDTLTPEHMGRPESIIDPFGRDGSAEAFYSSVDPLILQQNRRFQDQMAEKEGNNS